MTGPGTKGTIAPQTVESFFEQQQIKHPQVMYMHRIYNAIKIISI